MKNSLLIWIKLNLIGSIIKYILLIYAIKKYIFGIEFNNNLYY